MVVNRRCTRVPPLPPTDGMQRVDNIKILGVYLKSDLKMGTQITSVPSSWHIVVIRLAGTTQPRCHPAAALQEVERASTLSHVYGAGMVGLRKG